jgi:Protein of unknown function (DUF3306)
MTERKPPPPQAADGDAGFLSRWSRRKALVREGQELPADAPAPARTVATGAAGLIPTPALPQATPAVPTDSAAPGSTPPAKPSLSLADVDKLTAESNFAPFTARDVDPQVRNAALKKLFHADPHFNVMDGLDVYIGDYNTPDPLPKAIMRTMLQARSLGLLDDELIDQDKPEPDDGEGACARADTLRSDEDPDLQLQPDDAAGDEGAGGGAEPGAEPGAASSAGETGKPGVCDPG